MLRFILLAALSTALSVSAQAPAAPAPINPQLSVEAKYNILEARVMELERKMNLLNPPKTAAAAATAQIEAGKTFFAQDNLVSARLMKKELRPAAQGNPDMMTVLVGFDNHSDIAVASLKGELVFVDGLSGDSVTSLNVELTKNIPALGNYPWFGGIDYNAGDIGQVKFMNLEDTRVLVRLRLQRVLFTNGTVREYK